VLRVLLGLFVMAHGLVTFAIWAAPVTEKAPFNPSHSWLFGDTRTLAMILAVVAAIGFVTSGGAILAQQDWWAGAAFGAGVVAVALMSLYFNPWLLAGIAISAGILYAGFQALAQAVT
jgi:ABC-type uncharacterized transport system permease subunit